MRIGSLLSLSSALSLAAFLAFAPSAKADSINSGTAVVTYVNGSTGTAINSTTTYANVIPGTNFVTYVNGNAPAGNTTYSTSFQGFVGESGTLTFGGDDITSAFLNGFTIGNTNSSPIDTLITLNVSPAFFVNGLNVLSFQTYNTPNTPTGVDFSLTATTPEPGSFVLLGTGIAGLAGMARRRFLA